MDKQYLNDEFNRFFDFPTEDKSQVSSVSCKLFAEHIAYPMERELENMKRIERVCKAKLNGDFGAAAPQPEPVDSEPVAYIFKPNNELLWPHEVEQNVFASDPEDYDLLHTTPQPDRTAELEQLRQRVAALEKERDDWKFKAENRATEIRRSQGHIITMKSALKAARDTIKYYSSVCGEDDQPTPAKETLAKINEVLKP